MSTKKCDIKRCEEPLTIVYLTICAEGHINEFHLCKEHAVEFWLQERPCDYLHPIADHMAATVKGGEPEDYRFYLGEWVAVKDGKVIGHGAEPQDLVNITIAAGQDGTNIWQVKEEHLGR